MRKTLYEITGDIKDINTILINLNELRELEDADVYSYATMQSLCKMLIESLDTNLMLSEKLTNAQARWLGRDAQTTN